MRRRIMAVALPHLGAEARMRREGLAGLDCPFVLIAQIKGAMRLVSVDPSALKTGLVAGMGLADARAIAPRLVSRPAVEGDTTLRALARWAERFSPLVGVAKADTLVLDITGCAHLFSGEAAMITAVESGLGDLGLTARAGLADTTGAAWALAHFGPGSQARIAAPGKTRAAIGGLPVASLRISQDAADGLATVGLTTIEAVARVARGQMARRFGIDTMRRIDQALGTEPEPVMPVRRLNVFSVRLTLPEPVGLVSDVEAALERLLERLCTALTRDDAGARHLRLTARRVDGANQSVEIALTRPGRDPMRIRDLFRPKLEEIDAGYGIDALRLQATRTEPLKPAQRSSHAGHEADRLSDLLSRIGNRVGFDRVIRMIPAESHIPERSFTLVSAAWAGPEPFTPGSPRPIVLFGPEPIRAEAHGRGHPPPRFTWRRQTYRLARAEGPERISPEWWWDDPEWRSGLRDYWRVETEEGPRLWLFHTPAAERPGWYAHGAFT